MKLARHSKKTNKKELDKINKKKENKEWPTATFPQYHQHNTKNEDHTTTSLSSKKTSSLSKSEKELYTLILKNISMTSSKTDNYSCIFSKTYCLLTYWLLSEVVNVLHRNWVNLETSGYPLIRTCDWIEELHLLIRIN